MTDQDKKTEFISTLRDRVSYADREISKWQKRFKANPAFALEGCDGLYEVAAQRKEDILTLEALTSPESKATLDSIKEYATNHALQIVGNPRQSSSATSSLMRLMEGKAFGKIVDDLRRLGCR